MAADPPARPPLDPSRLATQLGRHGNRLRIEVLPESPSTNAELADRARAGAPEGTVVVAEHQTAGRGRLGRGWDTPARAALTVSVLLRPDLPAVRWPWLPLLTGYAVARTLRRSGFDAGLKWPNDVLVRGRKVCGILLERVEARPTTAATPAAVLGIGLNTTLTAEELPPTGTSLWLESGTPPTEPDRTALLAELLTTLLDEYDAWRSAPDDAALRAAYAGACTTLGREVRVELPAGGPLVGDAVDIDPDGRLVVRGPDGPVAVGVGDVVHVRPASGSWEVRRG